MDSFPLTISQSDLFLDNLTNTSKKKNIIINTVWAFADKDCDFSAMEKAFWQIVADNDCMRLRVFKKGRKKYQVIQEITPWSLPVVKADGKAGFDRLVADYENENYSFFSPCLFRARLVDCGGGAGGIQVRIHHLVCDGHSLGMFLREIDQNYQAIVSGKTPGKQKIFSFRSAVESDMEYLSGPEYKRDRLWWKKVYKSIQHYAHPLGRISLNNNCDGTQILLGKELSEKLTEYCKSGHISLQSAVLSMTGAYVAGRIRRDSFIISSLLHNRRDYRLKQTMGCMVAFAPVLFRMDPSQTVSDFLQTHYSEYIDIAVHSRFPGTDHFPMITKVSIRHWNFDFIWMQYSMMDYLSIASQTKLETGMADHHVLESDVYLYLLNTPADGLILKLDYRTKKMNREQAEAHLRGVASLISRAMEHPEQTMENILKEEP